MVYRLRRFWLPLLVVLSLACVVGGCGKSKKARPTPASDVGDQTVSDLIDRGEFSAAQRRNRMILAENPDLPSRAREAILFENERLERIKKDFTKSREEVAATIKKYIPGVSDEDLRRWEKERSLEFMIIDGKKKYFNKAAENLFRIDKKAAAIKEKTEPDQKTLERRRRRRENAANVIALSEKSGKKFVNPRRYRITFAVSVKPNAVPEGRIIRCWLPFPRQIPGRQTDVKLISTEPVRHVLADNQEHLQRTIYLEKPSAGTKKTIFKAVYEFTAYAVHNRIDPEKVKPVKMTDKLKPFVRPRPPHIVFTDELRALSGKLAAGENNPYKKARKIFSWVNENIPWASAREYSAIRNISSYCYRNRHGDCGIKTILFMTLCRIASIPVKWQSGWTTGPDGGNHDWGEIYFEPYGWVPVDMSYGLMKSTDPKVKWFYLGSMDGYRGIANDDHSRPLYPAKVYFRSDTVDNQRGEVEWKGGNLFYNKFDFKRKVEILK